MSPKHQISNIYSGPANFTAATLRRPSNATREAIDAIPNSNVVDSAMYERDKQIYKCSTMRPGGKFDKIYGSGGPKPSILNCPLPEIPRDARAGPAENGDPTSPPRNGNNVGVVHPTMTRYGLNTHKYRIIRA